MIIDISHHQNPSLIDYDKLAKQVKFVIIRTQYGSRTLDKYYRTHHAEFRRRGIPTAAYAWVRGINIEDMKKEANDFYNRTKDLNPTFWFLDVEEISMKDMRTGVKAYVEELRRLGAKKVGAYIAHHLYEQLNLDLSDFDAIWIPRYGPNNGKLHNMKPNYPCDLWQYTSKGRLDGYNGNLDLNLIVSDKPLSFFTAEREEEKKNEDSKKEEDKPIPDEYTRGIQGALNKVGFSLPTDGVPSEETMQAVRELVNRLIVAERKIQKNDNNERLAKAKELAKKILEV